MNITKLNNAAELAGALALGTSSAETAPRAKPPISLNNAADVADTRADVVELSHSSREHAAKQALATKSDIAAKHAAATAAHVAIKQASILAGDIAPAPAASNAAQDVHTISAPIAPPAQDTQPATGAATPDASQTDLNGLLAAYGAVAGDARFDARFDFNSDGRIDFNDLNTALSSLAPTPTPPESQVFSLSDVTTLLSSYGRREGEQGFDARFDTNSDGVVDFTDLNHVLSNLASPISSTQQQQLEGLIQGYGTGVGDPLYNASLDFDNDGRISFTDLNELLSRLAGENK